MKELSSFLTGESQTENDPVCGRSGTPTARVGSGKRFKKQPFMLKPATGTPITTMTAEVPIADASINQGTGDFLTVEDDPVAVAGAEVKLVRFARESTEFPGAQSFRQRA